jgi:hypothetical protein
VKIFLPKILDKELPIWYSKTDLEEWVSVCSFGPLDERQFRLFQVERITWEKDKSGR